MKTTRRALVGGMAATLAAPTRAFAAKDGERRFRVLRDGSDIGGHLITVRRSGDEIQVSVDIELKIKILGITAYRYEMANREVWRGGRLISMDSKSNDDGDPAFARVKRVGDLLEVEGSVWSGTAPGNSVSTTYWSYDFLKSPLWISTADGDPLKVSCANVGAGSVPTADGGSIATEKWRVTGDFEIDLHYVGREWASVRFDAGGEDALYAPEGMGPGMMAVWDAAM